MRLTNVLQTWLTDNEWGQDPLINEAEQTSSIGFDFPLKEFKCKCFFEANEGGEIFKFFMYFVETKCPEHRLDEAQKFITQANNHIGVGTLYFVRKDRIVRFYASIDVENASFEPAHIQNLVNAGIRTLNQMLPKYMAVCFGEQSAEDVFDTEE